MASRDIIVIGASLGGIRVLRELCAGLKPGIGAAIFVVCHTAADAPGVLAGILNDSGPLPAAYAEEGEPIRNGRIYVAPPDRHLLLSEDGVHLTRGPRENRFRPAIDPLFRSAATHYGRRVIGIVLTGMLDDGTQGLWYVKRRGGLCIVQDPAEAEAPSMPQSAIDEGFVDHIVSVSEMPDLLARLVSEPLAEMNTSHGDAAMSNSDDRDLKHLHPRILPGPQVPLSCPDCHGVLWLSADSVGLTPRYECHVGHQFSEQGLAAAKCEELEAAMWTALRTLKENAALLGTMGERARAGGRVQSAEHFERTQQEYHEKAQIIRNAIDANGS